MFAVTSVKSSSKVELEIISVSQRSLKIRSVLLAHAFALPDCVDHKTLQRRDDDDELSMLTGFGEGDINGCTSFRFYLKN